MTKHRNQQCAGIVVLVALFFWDNKKEEEQLAQISRDETLSRLPLCLSTNRVVELVQLRDTVRPVSICVLFSSSLYLSTTLCWTFSFCFTIYILVGEGFITCASQINDFIYKHIHTHSQGN